MDNTLNELHQIELDGLSSGLTIEEIESKQLEYVVNKIDHISNEIKYVGLDLGGIQEIGDNAGKLINAGKQLFSTWNEVTMDGGLITSQGRNSLIKGLGKVKDVFKVPTDVNQPGPPPPGGGGGNSIYETPHGGRPMNVQAAGSNPIEVKFDTPIKPRTYGDIQMTDDKNIKKYPLILSRQRLNTDFLREDSFIEKYVNSLVQKLNNVAQLRVNFATSFEYGDMITYFSTVCESLNAFYGIYSIIQFTQDYNNRNDAMDHLRLNISPNDLNLLDTFTRQVRQMPIPPRLVQLFYMLNANYRYDDLPKAPIIKFTSADIDAGGKLNFKLDEHIKTLNSVRGITNKLIRTIPNWYGYDLPMYGPETYHSRNFNTMWVNSGHVARENEAAEWGYFPTFTVDEAKLYLDKDRYYLSNTNDLDGLTLCFFSIFNDAYSEISKEYEGNHYITGLFRPEPFYSLNNNRVGYDSTGNFKFTALKESNDSLFTYEYAPVAKKQQWGDFGVDKEQIHGLNITTLRENTKEMFEWLFDFDAIPGRDSKSSNKSDSTSKRKRPRNRRKYKTPGLKGFLQDQE